MDPLCIASREYHAARREAGLAGASEEEAKEAGGIAYRAAKIRLGIASARDLD